MRIEGRIMSGIVGESWVRLVSYSEEAVLEDGSVVIRHTIPGIAFFDSIRIVLDEPKQSDAPAYFPTNRVRIIQGISKDSSLCE